MAWAFQDSQNELHGLAFAAPPTCPRYALHSPTWSARGADERTSGGTTIMQRTSGHTAAINMKTFLLAVPVSRSWLI